MGLQFVFRRRFDGITANEVLDGYIVDFVIAADHAEDRLFAVDSEGYSLDSLFYGNLHKGCQFFNGRAARRFDEFHILCVFCCHRKGCRFSLFNICRVFALRARYDFRFPCFGQSHEFVGMAGRFVRCRLRQA